MRPPRPAAPRHARALAGRRWSWAAAVVALAACAGELTAPTEPLRLLATALPAVYQDERLDLPLRPTGGLRPYTFTVVDGALPPGVGLEGGRLVGVPTEQGRFVFTLEVSDASLNRTVQRYELLVRPLPDPVLRVEAPATDVHDATILRLRLEAARAWHGAKVEVRWDAAAFELVPGSVEAARPTLAALWELDAGRLRVDVAALGTPLDGDHELLRFTLAPLEPARLALEVEAESRYAGRHHHGVRREGAPAAAAPPAADRQPAPAGPDEPADPADPAEPADPTDPGGDG